MTPDNDETAWLVESFSGQINRYLEGFSEEYGGNGFCYMPVWTSDHMRALRFSRREGADCIARVMSRPTRAKAVEHSWMVGPRP